MTGPSEMMESFKDLAFLATVVLEVTVIIYLYLNGSGLFLALGAFVALFAAAAMLTGWMMSPSRQL
jgi:hypothetical protein